MSISPGTCQAFLAEFSNFVDGTLDPDRRAVLLAHLDCCEACLRHLRAYRKGVAAYREAKALEPAWGLYDRVAERLGGERVSTSEIGDSGRGFPAGRSWATPAVLVMAVVGLLLALPGGEDLLQTGVQVADRQTSPESAVPTSYASVIPTALPLPGIGAPEADRVASAESRPPRAVRSEPRWAAEVQLAVVPRRELRIYRVSDVGGPHDTSLGGWPRRPPITIDRGTTSVMPTLWVAEAALRIP